MDKDADWIRKLSFPVNYSSDHSSDGDHDSEDVVVMRSSSSFLLADRGDGSEADLLGTTPPRELHRDKQKRRTRLEAGYVSGAGKRASASPTAVYNQQPTNGSSRLKQLSDRIFRKQQRRSGRAMKIDGEVHTSMPSPPAVPTLVDTCNRFMSLSSRLKCRESGQEAADEVVETRRNSAGAQGARESFHQTFSLLINMGSVDKGCRRTISREEQVWQNELKDLIWLELQAKLAGRSPAQQDAFLCAQRNIVPTIVQNIRDYRFVNPDPCMESRPLGVIDGSREDLTIDPQGNFDQTDQESTLGCLSLSCWRCSAAVGKALREVGTLLDSFYNATTLYPSTKAMTHDHPLIATHLFKNRVKAMCLWYNTALYLRLKVVAVRRMLRTVRKKIHDREHVRMASTDSELSRQSSDNRQCTVRFNVSNTPTDSNNSDSSAHSEQKEASKENPDEEEDKIEEEEEGIEKEDEKDKTDNADEVDSGIDRRFDQSGQTTPEIVITDKADKYSTTDTVSSMESGYASARDSDSGRSDAPDDVYDLGSLDDVTELRLLDKIPVSLYREYHREMLKTQGVRRCMLFINKMRLNVLHKVYETLEKPDSVKPPTSAEDEPVEVFDDTKDDEEDKPAASADDEDTLRKYELKRYGCWSAETLSMRLPSYRNHFLLLSSICLEAVHDYLSLRLEHRPINPSCLTVKQLIHELKEGLDIATEMRTAFARNLEVALAGHRAGKLARKELLLLVNTYDATVETVLKQYLSYVRTMSAVEQMSRSALQAEWSFTARLAKRVKCAALLAPGTFSEIACNQVNRVIQQLDSKFTELMEQEQMLHENMDAADPDKRVVFALCRSAQAIYAGEREAALQAAQWARALAARLARAPPPAYTTQRAAIFESLMLLRQRIVKHTQYILEASRDTGGEDHRDGDATAARVRELLLQLYRLGFEIHKELHQFARAPFKLVGEKQAKRARPVSLQPRPLPPPRNTRRRPETLFIHESSNPTLVHKELHRFVNEGRQAAPLRRAPSPPRGRARLLRSDSVGEDAETNVFDDKLFENINNFDGQTTSSIELLLIGEKLEEVELRNPPEGRNGGDVTDGSECVTETEKEWAVKVARGVVHFARCWMHFVLHRCDKGRGLRPRWASQGLEFLMLACDPCNTKHLTEEEFEELKKEMDGCISHVIGCRQATPRPQENLASPDPARRWQRHGSTLSSSSSNLSAIGTKDVPAPPTPPLEPDPLLSFHGFQPQAHNRRVLEAIKNVDSTRDEKLRGERRVGRVLDVASVASFEPKLRQLKFKWQRGLKIGAGTFGKVYTVVNTESGQLLAMKELSIVAGAGDRRALRRAANELQVLEGVVHPHLVRYYGCELHREEMLIFMELCVEGSLEALIATSGALGEHTVRKYTKQLVSAVIELHSRGIAHRDIKSGNIFLTNEGHCLKLGDFGCAVKIRAQSTAAGELQGIAGTQAYMAPEVFMKSSGHGRAADIWSLGCVVTEMASGKRPWPEYDSNYQIMFVVGMGGRPSVPDSLSAEGHDFCLACLTHEPNLRPKANELIMHHFLMVKSDDDCNCESGYLMAYSSAS